MDKLTFLKVMKTITLVVLIFCIVIIALWALGYSDMTTQKIISTIACSVSLFLNYLTFSIHEENERHYYD